MLCCARCVYSCSIIVQNEGDMKEMKFKKTRISHNFCSLRDKLEILSPSSESRSDSSIAYTIVQLSFKMREI